MTTQPLTPDHILFRAQTTALIRVLGPKKGGALLRAMAEDLATEVNVADVIPIRGSVDHSGRVEATKAAVAAFRRDLPTLVAALPR